MSSRATPTPPPSQPAGRLGMVGLAQSGDPIGGFGQLPTRPAISSQPQSHGGAGEGGVTGG